MGKMCNETGNKFGRGIEFREGSPVKLLEYVREPKNNTFGQIILNEDALNIIRNISEPLAIISVGKPLFFF